ncbi:MAG: response regulator [Chloroflexi bacterium]|nr:response regulator [Chloroflexota bacterium]MBT4143534.1 response regulator [Chloroflexota bacterium]MBT4943718.1 response regulator [Chloroflexota bacterium]MBT5252846.1 response regulator [Chloroflexota bacterium]MBT5475815.1 response regulator [Chloroflexota bacterium]
MARILVVDDSPDVRLALAAILEDAVHDIVEAEDGDQVFDLAVSESPNLVLLDVMMPQVNGFDALATFKDHKRTSPIPVIMVTAKGRLEDIRWLSRSVLLSTSLSPGPTATSSSELTGRWLLTTNRRAASISTESTLL